MKTLIIGNSSSGKSTLAKTMVSGGVAHLDLDVLAWLPTVPPQRQSLAASHEKIEQFMNTSDSWVIEGCYSDLLVYAAEEANELIFLNLPIEVCVANAKKRPLEPHKYKSKAAQDTNLPMLIDWIEQYPLRDDECALNSHLNFYKRFSGPKKRMTKMGEIQHL